MELEYSLKIVMILTIGFALASLFGYFAQRFKLPPILGYLLAGYVIGPFSPGFVADLEVAEQLAEIGVILMLFGVGLHFHVEDLIRVQNVALPGAIVQTLVAAIFGTLLVYYVGWSLQAGIITGLSIGVASTVVLVRVLTDFRLLNTPQGHISVGWLVVEDILTVVVLLLLPLLADFFKGQEVTWSALGTSLVWISTKFIVLIALMFTWGHKIVALLLTAVARLRSHELLTLTVLALTFIIATGSALVFGTSIALGAFIAGMVIGKTDVKQQASAHALPLKDVFAVMFFISVGMLFNPHAIVEHFILFMGVLSIILVIKPLTAFLFMSLKKYPLQVALVVSVALAQIGEFSFILAEEANNLDLFPDEGFDVLVACAIISISLNPLFFRYIERYRTRKSETTSAFSMLQDKQDEFPVPVSPPVQKPQVIVVGFGPIGKTVTETLESYHMRSLIIEQNIDTVPKLKDHNRQVVYGDASQPAILESCYITKAELLVITVPDKATTVAIIQTARQLNPSIRILARIRFADDIPLMHELKVDYICCEDETAKAIEGHIYRLMRT